MFIHSTFVLCTLRFEHFWPPCAIAISRMLLTCCGDIFVCIMTIIIIIIIIIIMRTALEGRSFFLTDKGVPNIHQEVFTGSGGVHAGS